MLEREWFEHPHLQVAYEEMKEVQFFEKEVMFHYEKYEQKKIIPDLLGKTVKVTERQMPALYLIIEQASRLVGCPAPDVYVYEDFYYGVETKGIGTPWIEISAKTVTDLTELELLFLIGRELCHIQMNYQYYHVLIEESQKAVHFNLIDSELLKDSLKVMMYQYSRLAHYSADCFGYALCGSLDAAFSAISKLVLNSSFLASQLYMPDFLKQSEEIEALDDDVSRFTKKDERVPYAPLRLKHLLRYASSTKGVEAVKYLKEKGR